MPAAQAIPRRVAVVGAGLAGLSAAMRLRAAGCEVMVLEQSDDVGGLCRDFTLGAVRHDAGPTVLTMPAILSELFAALGTDLGDYLTINRLEVAYRARYADGSRIEVGDTVEKTAASIADACGASEAARFAEFAAYCQKLYDAVFEPFMNRSFDSPLGLLGRPLIDLARLGGFASMQRRVNRLLHDPRTRRLVSFQALYAGVPPTRARALYNVITYMDIVAGVYSPIGGMAAIPRAMARVITDAGGQISLGTTVRSVIVNGGRATGVLTDDGPVAADAVVLTCDPARARQLLGLRSLRRPLRRSPSCILVHAHVPATSHTVHHTIHFGNRWDETFRELINGHPMSDPSLLVSLPAQSDPSRIVDGTQPLYLLIPCPNGVAASFSPQQTASMVDEALARLRQRGCAIDPQHIVQVVTPTQWSERGMIAGTPFSIAHTFSQTGPFRPRNGIPGLPNVALAGAGTVPGVGVPTVLISGGLAAARVIGGQRGR